MWVHLTCPVCDVAFERRRSRVRSSQSYCSRACAYAGIRQGNLAPIVVDGDIARIPLRTHDGTIIDYALIDAADVPLVQMWPWHLDGNGYPAHSAWTDGKRIEFKLHRVLLGLDRGNPLEGDHLNRVRTDNRRANLRIIPKTKQSHNRRSHRGTSSQYRGVNWHKASGRWHARVMVNGKAHSLGLFTSEEEAAACAREARARLLPYAVD